MNAPKQPLPHAAPANFAAAPALQAFADWMAETPLPLWARDGMCLSTGFAERLDFGGRPIDVGYLRLRVMARQVVVFSSAAAMGMAWTAPVAEGAWAALTRHFWSPVTKWSARIGRHRQIIDLEFTLYDQAFAVYACACWAKASGSRNAIDMALQTLTRIDALLARRRGVRGWRSAAHTQTRDQNSHMHLLEAALALHEIAPGGETAAVIVEVLAVAANHLFDPASGTISEWFDDDWRTVNGQPLVEPGHQYEWYWLLDRAAAMGFACAIPRERLYEFACRHGWSAQTGLAFDACGADGAVREAGHRLWPHCEAIRAATVHPDRPAAGEAAERIARRTLDTFLATDRAGLWTDRFDGALQPAVDHVPASSLYHLWEAAAALHRAGWATLPGAAPC